MSTSPPEYQQNATPPPGNVPKNRQTWVMLGVAACIVAAVLLTGTGPTTPKPVTTTLPPPPAASSKQEIDRFTRSLAEDEARLRAAQENARRAEDMFRQQGVSTLQGGIPGQNPSGAPLMYAAAPAPAEQVDPLEAERKKREYAAVFASNIALSYRRPLAESLRESEREVKESAQPAAPPVVVPPSKPGEHQRRHVLLEGTLLEGVLTNRLEGSFSGPVNVMVKTDVYSRNRQHLLIKRGSRLIGEAKPVSDRDQERLAIVFHRLIMPDGFSVRLEDEQRGLDQAGATGIKDKVNHHYLSTFGTSIALGLLAGFSMYNTRGAYSSQADAEDYYRQGVAQQFSTDARQILSHKLNRMPDITIREGQRVSILLEGDLMLPAYDDHPAVPGV